MQYTFDRDSSGSFLVVRKSRPAGEYFRKMLETGEIPFLLQEHIVFLDGECEFRFRIGGMQTMEKKFEKKRMRTEDVTVLLERLATLRQALAAHLLPDSHLFLSPDLIYVPYPEPAYCFIYLPEEETVFSEQLCLLSDFMMKHVSYEDADDEGVELVYALQSAVHQDGFDLQVWWQARHAAADAAETSGADVCQREDAGSGTKEEQAQDFIEIVSLTDDWDMKWKDDPFSVSRSGKGWRAFVQRVLRQNERHRHAEEKKKRIGMRGQRSKPGQGKNTWSSGLYENRPEFHSEEADSSPFPAAGLQDSGTVCLSDSAGIPEEGSEAPRIHALIPLDGGAQIPVDRPFLLIGTSARNVDIVLKDHTVSRVHAELFSDASGVRIEDCNSSNGTIVDGQFLKPNELKTLETGMHIRFGRSEFVFR